MANLNLFEAVKNNDLDRTRFYAATNADVLEKDENGWTLLHWASIQGHFEIVKLLVELMSNNMYNINDSNINDYGMSNTKTNILEKDECGWTALHWAAYKGNLEIAKLLIESCFATNAKANILEKDNHGYTALHLASRDGHLEITKLLIQSCFATNANINILEKNNNSWTALHFASREGHLKIVKLLIEFCLATNANISEKDNDGLTALHFASYNGHLEIAKLLVSSGMSNANISNADFNILEKDNDGCTQLHIASMVGHFEIVKYLTQLCVDTDVDFNIKDNKGKTTIDVAKTEEIKDFLTEQLEIQQNRYLLK